MSHIALVSFISFAAGLVIALIGHAMIVEKEAATKVEIAGWATRLRNAMIADAASAKAAMSNLVIDIEKKL